MKKRCLRTGVIKTFTVGNTSRDSKQVPFPPVVPPAKGALHADAVKGTREST